VALSEIGQLQLPSTMEMGKRYRRQVMGPHKQPEDEAKARGFWKISLDR